MAKRKNKSGIRKITEEYASHSTIHGIGYVFDRDIGLSERILWLLGVLSFLSLAGYFTSNLWVQWKEEQVERAACFNRILNSSTTLGHYYLYYLLLRLQQT